MFESGLSAAWLALAGGVFLAGLAVELGASSTLQGFLASLPFLAGIAQVFGAYSIERHGAGRNTVAIRAIVASRIMIWAIIPAVIGLMPGSPALMLAVLVALVTAAFLLHGVANVATLGWMAELVPQGEHGRFFGARHLSAGIVNVTVTLAGGMVAGVGFGPPHAGYLILIFLAGGFGLGGAYALTRMTPPPPCPKPMARRPFIREMRRPLADAGFRKLLLFYLSWMGSVYFASPFFMFYFLQDLKMDLGFAALTSAALTVGGLTTVRMWGRLCDRHGNKPVLYVTLPFAALIPFAYLFTHKANILWASLVLETFGGAVWSGITLASTNLLLKLSPRENNAIYLSTFGVSSGIVLTLVPIAGGFAADLTASWRAEFAGVTFYHFKFIFLASFVARVLSLFLLPRVPETGERPVAEIVRELSSWRTLWSVSGLELAHGFYRLLTTEGRYGMPAVKKGEPQPGDERTPA